MAADGEKQMAIDTRVRQKGRSSASTTPVTRIPATLRSTALGAALGGPTRGRRRRSADRGRQ
jgi:hypothetical protein